MAFLRVLVIFTWYLSVPPVFSLRFDDTDSNDGFLEEAVSKAVDVYMVDESSLGFVAPQWSDGGVSGRRIRLPMVVYDLVTLTMLCHFIVTPVDGYVFMLTDKSLVKTHFVRVLECFNTTTLKLKTKRILLVDVTSQSSADECEEFTKYFRWLWTEYDMANAMVVTSCVQQDNILSPVILSYNPFSGQLLTFDIKDGVAGEMKARFGDLHGHHVRALLFPHGLGSDTLLMNDSKSIKGGPDATLRWALETQFNLTFDVGPPRDGVLNSFVLNGTHYGSLAECIKNYVDINLVVKMVKWYETDRIQFLMPRLYGELVVLVRRRGRVHAWNIILHVFTLDVWLRIGTTIITVCGVAKMLAKTKPKWRRNELPASLVIKSVLSIGVRKVPRRSPERIIMTSCLLFSIVVINLFFGQFFSLLKTRPRMPNIDSLYELRDANLPVYAPYNNLRDSFDAFENTPLADLKARLSHRVFDNGSGLWLGSSEFAGNWEFGVLISKSELQMQRMMLSVDAADKFHVVRQKVLPMNIAHIMPIASIYYDRFNLFSIRLSEHGLFQHWHERYMLYVREKHQSNHARTSESSMKSGLRPLTVKDLRFPLVVLFLGLLLSTFVFVCELWFPAKRVSCLFFKTIQY